MANRTLYRMFEETVQKYGEQRAIGFRPSKNAETTYWTYNELYRRVRALRRGLDALGLQNGDRIALLTENRAEWAIVDLAAQSLGLVNVAPYSTVPASQVAFIVRDSGARLIVVSDAKQRAKVAQFRQETPCLQYVVALDGDAEQLALEGVLRFEDLMLRGEQHGRDEAVLDALSANIDPDSVATLVYTSGTTGDPKGAMLSHNNILQTPDAVVDEPVADLGPGDTFLSFLPLSHITERVGGYYLPLRVGACIVYSRGLASIGDEITTTVRPTALLCVPRLYENMVEKAMERLAKQPERQRKIAEWGLNVGLEAARRRSDGRGLGIVLAIQHRIAEKLVLVKLRTAVTGGNLRYCVSGGAPLDRQAATFFLGIGIQLLEGYGLSETSIIAINRPARQRIGTVGVLMQKVELKFADDGEILMRGQGRMEGYFNKPEATAEAIDEDGWFHTGDIGELSGDGYLSITDRKKDLIVLNNGKKVAPQPIEADLKHSPFIAEAVLFGDHQSTVMALLVPVFDKLAEWAMAQKLPEMPNEELVNHPDVLKLYRQEIERYTPHLADFEKVKRFKLVPNAFGIESGELTPTLKVKRKFVAQKYADLLASIARQ